MEKKTYTLHQVGSRQAVLTFAEDRSRVKIGKSAVKYPNADYRGTGMALAGFLKPGQSVTGWLAANSK